MSSVASQLSTRRALLALALGGFGIGTGEFVVLGLLPNVAGSLRVGIPSAGHLISAYALGVVVGAPLVTILSVRFPRKGFLVGAALAMAAGSAITALSPGFGVLLVVRFLAGLPHGAYFGVASVVAAGLVTEERRSRAMSIVFAGLTLANVAGVPIGTLVGQHLGWRVTFWLIAAIEVVAALAILAVVPRVGAADLTAGAAAGDTPSRPDLRGELRAFRQSQIWLSLGVATVGGGALFCTFSYITPLLTHVAGFPSGAVTPLLVLFGVGMTLGNLVGARLADRGIMRTLYVALIAEIVCSVVFFFAVHSEIGAAVLIVLFPACALALLPALQSRIVSLAGGAPNLAAASIHAAFNVANSIGAWLGGAVIAGGLGYASVNLAAAGVAALGLCVAVTAGRLERRARDVEYEDSAAQQHLLRTQPTRGDGVSPTETVPSPKIS